MTGIASLTDFQIVGRIMGTEVLGILFVLGLAMFGRPPMPDRLTTRLIGLALLWLVAQFVSDLVNQSRWDNSLRGLARAGATMIMLYGLHVMLGNRVRRVHVMFLGLAIGGCVAPLLAQEGEDFGDPWKFGYGTPVTMFCMVAATWLWRLRLRSLALLPPLLIALVNIFLGYRSMAGIALAVFFIQMLVIIFGTLHVVTGRQALFLSLLAGGLVGGIIPLYGVAAEAGWLGEGQQERYLEQVNDQYGILLSGRTEWRIAPLAFLEKPLLGHGSWAEDERYAQMSWEIFTGSTEAMPPGFSMLIPSHSHLLGALVEGGILSGLFWFMVLFLLGHSVITLVRHPILIDPIISFVLFCLGWAVLFSPYGLGNRVFACFAIITMTVLLQQARQLEQSSARLPRVP
ncbi:hypothetical protein [Niveispirillum sp. SYP-B3756]|uniref:hypothetical protein n=1 Tax=Niveispirillum sp. SYP-B3756 TaxID=2662178 RepID=UPI001B3BD975|nr:hypothetical protein [Niveispirillum sp. SYP-B3756]